METQLKCTALRAAILIQRWYRRYRARVEIRRRATWTIFTSLEYAGENDQIELYNFFNALLKHIPEATAASRPSAQASSSTDSKDFLTEPDEGEEGNFDWTKTYKGPLIQLPLQKKDIDMLIDLFRKKKGDLLPPQYVAMILREAASKLKLLSNFNQASTAISKNITIVGDLHGNLDDLLVIFYKNGLPSTTNPYIFNGDFVDRGKKGLEVLLLLLVCFLVFPSAVYLNRGNHEDSVMNSRYGFIRELNEKYYRKAERLIELIEEVYRWLPLGSIINNRVFVVHGGISDQTNLDLIKSIDRGKFVSILRPPIEMVGDQTIYKNEWKQIFDIMWSDPQIMAGCIPNKLRGAGTCFGPDVTESFLTKNNLQMLVRSHECKPEGHEFLHNGKLITIFSASNYYAPGSNKGAYLKLGPQLDTQFVQYVSAASKVRNLTIQQRVSLIENSAVIELGGRVCDKRDELEKEFKKLDPKGMGTITVAQWSEVMQRVTQINLPWRLMRNKLGPPPSESSPNLVNYLVTLELLETDIILEEAANATSVTDALYTNRSSLEAIFHMLDRDNSGLISLDEFGYAIDLMQKHMHNSRTREEMMNMCKLMDINKDGFVDLNEFLEAFRLSRSRNSESKIGQPGTMRPPSVRTAQIANALTRQNLKQTEGDIDPKDHA